MNSHSSSGLKFSVFSGFLARLEETSSRLEITRILGQLLYELKADEIKEACYLLIGSVAPSYEGVVFNVAEKMMERALALAFDMPVEEVTKLRKELGDLGLVAHHLATNQKSLSPDDLSIHQTFQFLYEITEESGDGSQDKRIELLSTLLKKLQPQAAKAVTRMVMGRLRLGFSEKTIIEALSWMEVGDKSNSRVIAKAYEVVPDIGALAEMIKREGSKKAAMHLTPIIGIPVQPMLCQRLKSPTQMVEKMGMVAVEPKFDGLRVLIHFSKKKNILRAFTRNLKDISAMFPELGEIAKHINAQEIILDSEAVGMDPTLMKMADFQTTMQRRRKHEIEETQSKIPITFQVFDVIYADNKNYMSVPYTDRRDALKALIKNGSLLKVDEFHITDDPERITALHHQYRAVGLEGIIVKKTDSEYVPGRLGWRWVKMKEEEHATGKLPDTVDGVIMGYSQGKGKRVSFGIGQFLVGIRDGNSVKTLTKVGTGLTDDQFKELEARLSKHKVDNMPAEYEVHKDLYPDYWVKPTVVVELAGDDMTISPKHTAGYALRFPRLVRFRDDKSLEQATTLKEIVKLFHMQTTLK